MTVTTPPPAPSTSAPSGSPARDSRSRPAAAPTPTARVLGRRASLPGGRAVIGALLVTLAAVGTFAAYTASTAGPRAQAVVATIEVRAGDRLHAEDLRTVAVDLLPEQLAQVFASPAELDGAVALAPIAADELVNHSAVLTASTAARTEEAAGARELSFALEREHALGGRLKRGEQIDLVATYGSGSDAYTTVVARQATVLDTDLGSGSVGSSGRVTITITLRDEAQVLEATHALEVAKVTVVRATGADHTADGAAGTRYQPAAPSSPATRRDGTTTSTNAGAGGSGSSAATRSEP